MLKKAFPVLILLALCAGNLAIASSPPGPPSGPPPCWPPPCTIPIDGGISFLIAAGVALGGKKLYDRSKASKSE